MAEETQQAEEVIIIEDDSHEENNTDTNEDELEQDINKNKKLLIIGGIAVGVLLIVLIALLIVFILNKKEKHKTQTLTPSINEKFSKKTQQKIAPSQVENMIAKANYLYHNGNKDKALKLYEKISNYNESLSKYNLGVAQLSNKQYKKAYGSFKSAIKNGEHICVSAINTAVCALYLHNQDGFEYYINLAESYLPNESSSKLYSYYYTLIQFYKEDYYKTLASLTHRNSDEYTPEQNFIQTKIYTLYGDYTKAIDSITSPYSDQNGLSLALLYANVGELSLAQKYLQEYALQNKEPLRTQLALAYIKLKSKEISNASPILKAVDQKFGLQAYTTYPIKVKLKESLYDVKLAQKYYRNKLIKSKNITYQKVFYYSPYKIFNAYRTIDYIKKGNANIYIDDIGGAKNYLNKSLHTSGVNSLIAKAIKLALAHHLREANTLLLQAFRSYPKHSILNYDLGLTFAQMGDYENAYKYFLKSYYLNANNYLPGIYAVMCEQVLKIHNPKLLSIIKSNLQDEGDSENFELYRNLISFLENNFIAASRWIDNSTNDKPLYLLLKTLISEGIGKKSSAKYFSEKLSKKLPSDILSNLLYIETHFSDDTPVEYVKHSLQYLRNKKLSYDTLYYGSNITRVLFIQTNLINGTLYPLVENIQDKLDNSLDEQTDIIQALALAALYNRQSEKAYVLYNQLIDTYKLRDSKTLFLAAVASTEANHHANAIALLELAKIKNTKNFESRYALGLLYMEKKNNNGASIQFGHIDNGFESHFFNFNINTDLLLFNKNQKDAKEERKRLKK